LPKRCNTEFVNVIVLKDNVKKNCNYNIDIAYNVTISGVYSNHDRARHVFISI